MKPRKNEQIGGGWMVFRRGKRTGRIAVKPDGAPFEHPDKISAQQEARRLAEMFPGERFVVWRDAGFSVCVERPAEAKKEAAEW